MIKVQLSPYNSYPEDQRNYIAWLQDKEAIWILNRPSNTDLHFLIRFKQVEDELAFRLKFGL
jgi:hypothetical protein